MQKLHFKDLLINLILAMNFLSLKYLLLEWKLENYIAWKMILWETKLRKVLD